MARSKKLPLVAVCGRPNVGKSTLFNRIIGRQSAIVHSEEGITRDRAYGRASANGRVFRLVDTGGIVENPTDPVTHKMQEQVRAALNEADVVLFVVDAQQAITRVDEEVRDELFRLGKPVVLAANKLDNDRLEMNRMDFYALGMGDPIAVSSTHGRGMTELLEALTANLPPVNAAEQALLETPAAPAETDEEGDEEAIETPAAPGVIKVAIVGKPNVGKSSFINALLNEDRTIVTDIPGTTRDAIDIDFHWKGKDYLLIDTAGLRKKSGIKAEVERFSVARSLRAIRRADVCLLMVEATEGITEQDKRIISYVQEQGAGLILVFTKWDLVEDREVRAKKLPEELAFRVPFLKYVPFLTISNVTRQRLFQTFDFVDRVAAEAAKRISTAELNKFLETLKVSETPATHKGSVAKIRYGTQTDVRPPTFVFFVNSKRLFHFSYLRHIENRLRAHFSFEGVPVKFELREGNSK